MLGKGTLIAILLAALSAGVAASVEAGELPSETDLRAAYCISINRQLASFAAVHVGQDRVGQQAQEIVADSNDRADRLALYLLPRMKMLDPVGLIAAMKHGEVDAAKFWEDAPRRARSCLEACAGHTGGPGTKGCIESCLASDELLARVEGCKRVNWLPF